MNKDQIPRKAWIYRIGLLFVLAFALSVASFLRQALYGADSYAALLCMKGQDCWSLAWQPWAVQLYAVLPAIPVVINVVMLVALFFSLLAIFLLVKREFDERLAWFSVFLLAAASPLLTFAFHNWENDLLAYPFLFFALYFLSIGVKPFSWKKGMYLGLGLGCLFVASQLWALSAYFLVPLVFLQPIVLGLLAYVVFAHESNFFGMLFWLNRGVVEARFGVALLDLFFLVLVVPFAFFWCRGVGWRLAFVSLFVLVVLNGSLAPLLLPFFALGIAFALTKLDKKRLTTWMDLKTVCIIAVFLLFCWQLAFFWASPTQIDRDFVKEFAQMDKNFAFGVYNDWSYGYWLENEGLHTTYKGGFPNPDYNNLPRPYYALTNQRLNCKTLKEVQETAKHTAIYACN